MKKREKKARPDEEIEEKVWRRLYEEAKIEEMRIKMETDYENKEGKKLVMILLKVKLPKLVISNFEGTVMNWFHFWNLFQSENSQTRAIGLPGKPVAE